MRKGFYKILIALMSVALIGLILIQVYWLRITINSSLDEFKGRVYQAMNTTSEKINQIEIGTYYTRFEKVRNDFLENQEKPEVFTSSVIKDSLGTTHMYFTRYILERSSIPISGRYNDSLRRANIYSQESVVKIPSDSGVDNLEYLNINIEETFRNSNYTIERLARLDAGTKPIEERINISSVASIFADELRNMGVKSHPQLAVLKKDSTLTKVHSEGFQTKDIEFIIPLFNDKNDEVEYFLASYLPDKKISILGPVIPIVALTIIFTLIIISVFSLAIYYMQMQRKISEVKTDFINNMTHEFKTPIATINIAADSIKNDKILTDKEKVKYYADLIKKENKRMNAQVEMVLRMSKLEKNQIDLELQPINIHEILKNSVNVMRFMIEEANGTIFESYEAERFIVSGDPFHLENVMVNLLDNARKYSEETPKISIETYNEEENVIVKIEDKGIGMSKTVLKKVFEEFYREETGNVHNIKGHGLGLSYVKKIIELHKGKVYVESEKNKGSVFFIKLSTI